MSPCTDGRGVHLPLGLELPPQRARLRVERIEVRVVRADDDETVDDDRRRLDFGGGLERPEPLAVRGVDGVHHAVEIADVDGAGRDCRRRLANPERPAVEYFHRSLPRGEIERRERAVHRAGVDDAVGDRRRRVVHVAELVAPEHLERGRQRVGGDAGQARIAAELRPVRRLDGRTGYRKDEQRQQEWQLEDDMSRREAFTAREADLKWSAATCERWPLSSQRSRDSGRSLSPRARTAGCGCSG